MVASAAVPGTVPMFPAAFEMACVLTTSTPGWGPAPPPNALGTIGPDDPGN